MKKIISLIVFAFLGLSLSAQYVYPVMEDFNNDWHGGNIVYSVTDGWVVDCQPGNSNCNLSHTWGDNFIYVYDDSSVLNETLETFYFNIPDDYVRVSFDYANPEWDGNWDVLTISYKLPQYSGWVQKLVINQIHDSWTRGSFVLPGHKEYQFRFTVETDRGYGFYLDNILIETYNIPVIEDYPVSDDFNTGANGGDVLFTGTGGWRINWKPENINCPITIEEGDYFIYVYSNSYNLYESLETCVFDVYDDNYLKLSFCYANPDWGGDVDKLEIGYRSWAAEDYTPLLEISEAHNNWETKEIILPGHTQYQFRFIVETHRGYGFYLDDFVIDAYDETNIVENDSQNIQVYPNPASDKLMIAGADGEMVRVYDNMGRVVMEQLYNGSLDVNNLARGVYAVSVARDVVKFVKE